MSTSSPMPMDQAPQMEPAGLSEPVRIVNTFVAPSKTFIDIRRNASWWVPWLLLSIVSVGFLVMVGKKVGYEDVARKMIASNSQMQQLSPEQQETAATRIALGFKVGQYIAPIFVLLYVLVSAAVLMASFNFGMDAQVPFNRALAIVMYGWLPGVVGTILAMLSLQFGNPEGFRMENPVGTNPAYFLDFNTTSKFAYGMLSSLDIVVLWSVVLIGMGFAINSKEKISTGSATALVAVWYFLWKLASAGLAALRG